MATKTDTSVQDMITTTFKKFDANGDGVIDKNELMRVLQAISGEAFSPGDAETMLAASDTNKDGKIDYEEFVKWVTKDMQTHSPEKMKGFQPLDKRGDFKVDFKKLLPERFDVDITQRFDLDKLELGAGGYGKVFIARDAEFENRKVAVKKVVKQGKKMSAEDKSSTAKEIQTMKDLDHPNICKLLATFEGPEGENTIYFVMELCEGGEVFDRIVETGFLSEGFTSCILRQVVSALAYAHGLGIAHRDIKPENVVFCSKDPKDRQVKLIDWGLAHAFTGGVMVQAVGSMTYAAPEVMQAGSNKPYTAACDLWSIGVFAYVMLCGKPPFWGAWDRHVRTALREQYPMNDHPWPKMNPKAKEFIRKLLKAKPEARMTAEQAAAHPWMSSSPEESECSTEIAKDVLGNIANFVKQSTFSKMCITAFARQLDHSSLADVHAIFSAMDVDNNGVLSQKEVVDGMKALLGKDSPAAEDLVKMYQNLDLDGSNGIDYTEFCAAGLCQKKSSQDEALWAAFKTFDTDNTGFISAENLQNLLDAVEANDDFSPEVCKEVGQEIISQFDKNKDGKICFTDFKDMMQKVWETKSKQPEGIRAYDLLNKAAAA